ncbi:MAG: hypothetical protein H3C64_03430 [Candidatus Kuenenia stuttgartiensis]|nr:hypothetical protein [Candidatus Kuenenia stuttgartiensis]
MPLNELEQHPFLDYYLQHQGTNDLYNTHTHFNGLIIGSFPIYQCTDTINEQFEVIQQRLQLPRAAMRFFYCSNQNSFWPTLSEIFASDNPLTATTPELRKEAAITLLNHNKLLITDVVYRTNRKGESSTDDSLLISRGAVGFIVQNMSLSNSIRDILEQQTAIRHLFFTATSLTGKSPFGWFRKLFNITQQQIVHVWQTGNTTTALELSLFGRTFTAFLLPTPAGNSGRGIHFSDDSRNQLFSNYIQHVNPDFYAQITAIRKANRNQQQQELLTQYRKELILNWYRSALVHRNPAFNGIANNV